jgi:cyclomaltodextrinase / maltogenic alpha-amylase / neopullulanase
MNKAALAHRPVESFVYSVSSEKLIFRFQAARKDLKSCVLVCWRRYEPPEKVHRIPMRCVLRDREHDYFSCKAIFQETACYIRYYFELSDGDQTIWYGKQGAQSTRPDENYFEYLYPNVSDGPHPPGWCERQIYYQIFPDRFRNGDTKNDPLNTVPWGTPPSRSNTMGGDLKGILDRLDYLTSLGITCLYLTPIFHGSSNHKYDTVDYYKIDPQFGTEEDLRTLTDQCHKRGIRVVLDGVFNHCGYYFPPFQDLIQNGEQSKYKSWFFPFGFPVKSDPPNYECFGYYKWMPKLNLSNPETSDYFIHVGKYWIDKCGIDGWRLDVADEIEGRFWERFSEALKQDFPNIVLIGESWGDAGRLVLGNRLDGAMNYLFKDAVTDWLAKEKIDAPEFDHRINRMLSLYPEETCRCMYNLLDSHDTPRFLYDCGGNLQKLKLAVAFMMTFPGCPAIFYGDEIGLTGANDPECRQAMVWDSTKQNHMLFDWYRRLIGIRKKYDALILGDYCTNLCSSETGLYGFIRSYRKQNIYIVLNPTNQRQNAAVPLLEQESEWFELLNEEKISSIKIQEGESYYNHDIAQYRSRLQTTMEPYSVKIFIQKVV